MSVLETPALVLNRNWQPVHVTTAYRAMAMLWSASAYAVCTQSYRLLTWDEWVVVTPAPGVPVIRTGRLKIAVPDVIRLDTYDRPPVGTVPFTRNNLSKRDRYTCQYCGRQLRRGELTVDHVMPRSKGGGNNWLNCVSSCHGCNVAKADRTPEQAGMRLIRQPFRPDWRSFHSATASDRWAPFLSRQGKVAKC